MTHIHLPGLQHYSARMRRCIGVGLCVLPLAGGCALPQSKTSLIASKVAVQAESSRAATTSAGADARKATPADAASSGVVQLAGFDHLGDLSAVPAMPVPVIAADALARESAVATSDATAEGMTLEEFEQLAAANNPTLKQLAATTQKAAGFRTQVGLRPNPTVGYQAVQLADRGTDQHTAFVEQEFVTANKLQLNRRVVNEALRAQLFELEAQRYRLSTDIRSRFYEALAAQKQIELINSFKQVTDKGFEIAELRKKASEGSQVDVLQSKIQKNEIELALQQTQIKFMATWRELAALSGTPNLQVVSLAGELPTSVNAVDWSTISSTLISQSPEFSAAQARVSEARANLQRHAVQAIPNLTAQLAAGTDNGTDSSLVNFQIGAPIPVFNKNQGNIAAANAEYCRAVNELQRIENSIQSRTAVVSNEFDSANAAVQMYATEILPSAIKTLELAEQAYQAGESEFLQVLVVRRTFYEAKIQYLRAQTQLALAQARVDGFMLSGGLDPVIDLSGDASLRDLTFSQR